LTAAEKADMAKKVSRYTGLAEDYLIKANLRVTLGQFMEELQRIAASPPAAWIPATPA